MVDARVVVRAERRVRQVRERPVGEVPVLGGDLLRLLQRLLDGSRNAPLTSRMRGLTSVNDSRSCGVRRIAAWIATRVPGARRERRGTPRARPAPPSCAPCRPRPRTPTSAAACSRSSRWPAQTAGSTRDAELRQLDRHRRPQAVLGDGANGLDVGLGRDRGLGQVVDGLAQQVQADVDVLGLQLAGDGDGVGQRGAGDESADQPSRQPAGAHQLLESLVGRCDEEESLDHCVPRTRRGTRGAPAVGLGATETEVKTVITDHTRGS